MTVEAHRSEKFAEQLRPPARVAFIEQLAHASDVHSAAQKFRADLKGARSGVRILKRSGIGRDRNEEVCCDGRVNRESLAGDQFEKNLARSRRRRVDVNQVAVTRIAGVMVDIDPDFRATHQLRRGAETILGCRIERDGDVEILWFAERGPEKFATGQEAVFFEETVFVSDHDFFSKLGKGKAKTELAAERVTIRPDMTEDGEAFLRAKNRADLLEARLRHCSFGASIC